MDVGSIQSYAKVRPCLTKNNNLSHIWSMCYLGGDQDLVSTFSNPALKSAVHISAFWLLMWFSFLQVTLYEGNKTRIIRDCMNKTFFKEMNPGAPDSGCVKVAYKEEGKVSKKLPRFF